MTLKMLGKFTEATQMYKSMEKKFRYSEGFNIMKQVVSIILLPLTKDKRH